VPFAADRIDTWVLRASIAVPVLLLVGLALWHLAAYLRPKRRKAVRLSPEPPAADPPPRARPPGRGRSEDAPPAGDPEQLRQSCAALEGEMANLYLALADSCARHGQPEQAAAALHKILRLCPGSRQAQVARERLQQLGKEAGR
jgi:hypothetical protein